MTRIIVITGCSSGFGKQLALQQARHGCRVYATMRGVQGKNAFAAEELTNLAASEGIDLRVRSLNAATEPFDTAVLEAFGMAEFAPTHPRSG